MISVDTKTKIDALKLLRQFHESHGNQDKVAELDLEISEILEKTKPVEKPKRQKSK